MLFTKRNENWAWSQLTWTVLGVTSQTPFTCLANVKDLNFVRGGGENLVKAVFMKVYCRLTANSIQKTWKGEVSQNLFARIVDVGNDEYIVVCNFADRIMSSF